MSLACRLAADTDFRFVVSSFVDSYRESHAAGLVAMEDWSAVMVPQFLKVLARPGVDVFVAHNPEAASSSADLYGWLAVERNYEVMRKRREGNKWIERKEKSFDPLIHYVYVKQPYREMGVARLLFKAAKVDPLAPFNFTCKTAPVSKLIEKRKIPFARWQPLIARFPKTSNP